MCTAQAAQSQIVAAPPTSPGIASLNAPEPATHDGRPVQGTSPVLDLSAIAANAARIRMAPGISFAKLPSGPPAAGISLPSISIGSVRAEIGGTANGLKHGANFRLEGVSLFGSSISGSVDGRSARLTFTWPTNF